MAADVSAEPAPPWIASGPSADVLPALDDAFGAHCRAAASPSPAPPTASPMSVSVMSPDMLATLGSAPTPHAGGGLLSRVAFPDLVATDPLPQRAARRRRGRREPGEPETPVLATPGTGRKAGTKIRHVTVADALGLVNGVLAARAGPAFVLTDHDWRVLLHTAAMEGKVEVATTNPSAAPPVSSFAPTASRDSATASPALLSCSSPASLTPKPPAGRKKGRRGQRKSQFRPSAGLLAQAPRALPTPPPAPSPDAVLAESCSLTAPPPPAPPWSALSGELPPADGYLSSRSYLTAATVLQQLLRSFVTACGGRFDRSLLCIDTAAAAAVRRSVFEVAGDSDGSDTASIGLSSGSTQTPLCRFVQDCYGLACSSTDPVYAYVLSADGVRHRSSLGFGGSVHVYAAARRAARCRSAVRQGEAEQAAWKRAAAEALGMPLAMLAEKVSPAAPALDGGGDGQGGAKYSSKASDSFPLDSFATVARMVAQSERRAGGDWTEAALARLLGCPADFTRSDDLLVDGTVRGYDDAVRSRHRQAPQNWQDCMALLPAVYGLSDASVVELVAEARLSPQLRGDGVCAAAVTALADALARCWRAWLSESSAPAARVVLTCDLANSMGCVVTEEDWPKVRDLFVPPTKRGLDFEGTLRALASVDVEWARWESSGVKGVVAREHPELSAAGAEQLIGEVLFNTCGDAGDATADMSTYLRVVQWLRSGPGRTQAALLHAVDMHRDAVSGVPAFALLSRVAGCLPGVLPADGSPIEPAAVAVALSELCGCGGARLQSEVQCRAFALCAAAASAAFADSVEQQADPEAPEGHITSPSIRSALRALLPPCHVALDLRSWPRVYARMAKVLLARSCRRWPDHTHVICDANSGLCLPGLVLLWAALRRCTAEFDAHAVPPADAEDAGPGRGEFTQASLSAWGAAAGLWPTGGEHTDCIRRAVRQWVLDGRAVDFADFAARCLTNEPLLAVARFAARTFAAGAESCLTDAEAMLGYQEAGLLRGTRRWAASWVRAMLAADGSSWPGSAQGGAAAPGDGRVWSRAAFLRGAEWLQRLRTRAARKATTSDDRAGALVSTPCAPWVLTPAQLKRADVVADAAALCLVHDVPAVPHFIRQSPPRCVDGAVQMLWLCSVIDRIRSALKSRADAAAADADADGAPAWLQSLLRSWGAVPHLADGRTESSYGADRITADFWSAAAAAVKGPNSADCDLAYLLSRAVYTAYLHGEADAAPSAPSVSPQPLQPQYSGGPGGAKKPPRPVPLKELQSMEQHFRCRDARLYDQYSGELRSSGELPPAAFWDAVAEAVPQLDRSLFRGEGVKYLVTAIIAHQDVLFHHTGPLDLQEIWQQGPCVVVRATSNGEPKRWTVSLFRKLVWRLRWLSDVYTSSLATDVRQCTTRPRLSAALADCLPGMAGLDQQRRHEVAQELLSFHEGRFADQSLDCALWLTVNGWADVAHAAFTLFDVAACGHLTELQLVRHLQCPLVAAEVMGWVGTRRRRRQETLLASVSGGGRKRSVWRALGKVPLLASVGCADELHERAENGRRTSGDGADTTAAADAGAAAAEAEADLGDVWRLPFADRCQWLRTDAMPPPSGLLLDYGGFLSLLCAVQTSGSLAAALARREEAGRQVSDPSVQTPASATTDRRAFPNNPLSIQGHAGDTPMAVAAASGNILSVNLGSLESAADGS
eukprot:TRINITY_DN6146_c0_g1_i1.p1 TRINITY_DN6146_c0_g1~~TRINITY_DN6146_c0_g1_i1.p1  ORF type:complete len:1700 (+),score=519.45 TRINITY_DN6146_c0_g1_i1:40-5100(+)